MKKVIGDNIRYWYLIVTVLMVIEICNQKLFATMIDPMHSMVLSCVIICVLFAYLGSVINSVVETYFSDKKVSDEALLQRIEVLENTLIVLDEKNKELENQLTAKSIENANNLYNMTLENMSFAFKTNQSYMGNMFEELEVQNRNGNEGLKDIVYKQNKVLQDICTNIDSDLKAQYVVVNSTVTEKTNDVINKLVEQGNQSRTNQEALVNSLANVEAKQAENITIAVKELKTLNIEGQTLVTNMLTAQGVQAQKQFDILEALVNNSRVDLYNRFELLKNEQKEIFANVLEQIAQMQSTTKDTIVNEIAKLRAIEDILDNEFEDIVEQSKYDASKPEIEVEDKYQVSKKNPNRVEMIVDDKLGTTLKNTYKNNKLSSSQIISNGKVTYEVVYDANERPTKSKSYDENGNASIELEYYENGQVKKRIQNVMQNGIKMKQTTNFDVNGNKI